MINLNGGHVNHTDTTGDLHYYIIDDTARRSLANECEAFRLDDEYYPTPLPGISPDKQGLSKEAIEAVAYNFCKVGDQGQPLRGPDMLWIYAFVNELNQYFESK